MLIALGFLSMHEPRIICSQIQSSRTNFKTQMTRFCKYLLFVEVSASASANPFLKNLINYSMKVQWLIFNQC